MKRLPSPKDPEKFWKEINRHKEKSRRELARLPFEKKIEILEQLQRDWKELMNSKEESKRPLDSGPADHADDGEHCLPETTDDGWSPSPSTRSTGQTIPRRTLRTNPLFALCPNIGPSHMKKPEPA